MRANFIDTVQVNTTVQAKIDIIGVDMTGDYRMPDILPSYDYLFSYDFLTN